MNPAQEEIVYKFKIAANFWISEFIYTIIQKWTNTCFKSTCVIILCKPNNKLIQEKHKWKFKIIRCCNIQCSYNTCLGKDWKWKLYHTEPLNYWEYVKGTVSRNLRPLFGRKTQPGPRRIRRKRFRTIFQSPHVAGSTLSLTKMYCGNIDKDVLWER